MLNTFWFPNPMWKFPGWCPAVVWRHRMVKLSYTALAWLGLSWRSVAASVPVPIFSSQHKESITLIFSSYPNGRITAGLAFFTLSFCLQLPREHYTASCCLIRLAKNKSLTVPSAASDVEQWEYSHNADGNIKWSIFLEISLPIFRTVEGMNNFRSSNTTSRNKLWTFV